MQRCCSVWTRLRCTRIDVRHEHGSKPQVLFAGAKLSCICTLLCRPCVGRHQLFKPAQISMAVAMPMVMMMTMRSSLFQLRRSRAAMGGLAAAGLELDRRVRDVKAVAQRAVDRVEDAAALGDRHLLDGHMTGERMARRAQRPAVQIMHIQHPGHVSDSQSAPCPALARGAFLPTGYSASRERSSPNSSRSSRQSQSTAPDRSTPCR